MKYRNKVTGAVLEVSSELSGSVWEEISSQAKAVKQVDETKDKKPAKKNPPKGKE